MFSDGNWKSLLFIVIPFVIFVVAQSFKEKGNSKAKYAQYAAIAIFAAYMIWLTIKSI